MEFETLDSKIAKRNHEDDTDRIQGRDQFLGGDSIQKRKSNACTGRQIMYHVFLFELYNDNLNMFNQAWEKHY